MEELKYMKHILTNEGILLPYRKNYQQDYLDILKEAMKEQDFIKYVIYANQKEFFYSDYSPYFFYNSYYDAHIYYKYIYDVCEIGQGLGYAKRGTYIKNKYGILFNQHIERKQLKKGHIVDIISYYPKFK